MARVPGSRRGPARHDAPLEPLQMSVQDAVVFAQQIATGYGGQAPWRRHCQCGHPNTQHRAGRCRFSGCTCREQRAADHEEMVIWLHPDAVNYLPEDVYVIATGHRYEPIGPDGKGGQVMGVQFLLGRDLGVAGTPVIHGGVRKTTHVFTDEPEDWHERPHESPDASERVTRPQEDDAA